jgi:NTP pyrophosphatase (non-canonical NTP hydrolase)
VVVNYPTDLDDRAREIHNTNISKGFWSQAPSVIPEKLMLITTEVAEAMEAFRDGDDAHLEEELADIIIRVLDLAEHKGFSMERAVIQKMGKNRDRPRLHGRPR